MTELDLYKFVRKNKLEYHWYDNDVLLLIPFYLLEDFNKMIGYHYFDEDGIQCVMRYDYCCFEMKSICEYFDIDIKNIFEKE